MKKVLCILLVVLSLTACGKKDDNVLTMATEATFEPYEYYDGDKIVGIDVEIAQAIAEKLGMELEVTDIDFDSLIPSVQSGKYLISAAGMTVSEERLQQINFTDTYATGIQVVIVKQDSPIKSVDDLTGDYIIGVQGGTTGEIYAMSDFGEDKVKSFKKTTDAASALGNSIDCIILDNEPAKAIVAKNEGFKILETAYSEEEYAIAVAKENTELLDKINNALSELKKDGTIDTIINKYIGD